MSSSSRLRRLEASTTARDVIDGWLDTALAHPNRDAYAASCLATDPPSHPLTVLRTEVRRLAASQPAVTRAAWLRHIEADVLVLYHLADALQADMADAARLHYHAAAHLRLRLEPLLKPAASSLGEDERRDLLAVWVPAARATTLEIDVTARVRERLEQRYFRGRDVRYRETVEADERVRLEQLILNRWLERIGPKSPDGRPRRIELAVAARVAGDARRRVRLAQWRALETLGEDERADGLLREIVRGEHTRGAPSTA